MKNKIKTIILDLGGVVLNRGIWLFREYLTKDYGVTDKQTIEVFIKKYYKPYFSGKISEEEFWKGVLKDLNIKEDWKKLRQKLLDFFKPNEGMFELLEILNKKRYKTILLSDQTKDWWPYLNKKYNISDHFDHTIISYQVGINKPDPGIYKIALKKGKSFPEESIFIDDLEHNLIPAKELGMKAILFKDCKRLKKDLILLGII